MTASGFDEDVFKQLTVSTQQKQIPRVICTLIASFCLRCIHLEENDFAMKGSVDLSPHHWMLRNILSNTLGFIMDFKFKLMASTTDKTMSLKNWKLYLVDSFHEYELEYYDSSLLYALSVGIRMNDTMNYSLSVCILGDEVSWDLFGDAHTESMQDLTVIIQCDDQKRRYCIQPRSDRDVYATKSIPMWSGHNVISDEWSKPKRNCLHLISWLEAV